MLFRSVRSISNIRHTTVNTTPVLRQQTCPDWPLHNARTGLDVHMHCTQSRMTSYKGWCYWRHWGKSHWNPSSDVTWFRMKAPVTHQWGLKGLESDNYMMGRESINGYWFAVANWCVAFQLFGAVNFVYLFSHDEVWFTSYCSPSRPEVARDRRDEACMIGIYITVHWNKIRTK